MAAIRRVMHEVGHIVCIPCDYVCMQPYGGGMFGRSLEETMEVEARLGGAYVPVMMHRCVKFIQEQGECGAVKASSFIKTTCHNHKWSCCE